MGESGSNLADKHCVPCRGGVPPLKGEALRGYADQLSEWKVVDEHHITKTYTFPDFRQALDFVNRAGAVAEAEGHHPDILLTWGKAEVKTYTHKIDGLTESDFILAAKIDQQYRQHQAAG
jgi:4a-hydroxytetrahydrobiopterin dehydratase